jgi:serine/threonine protein kinase
MAGPLLEAPPVGTRIGERYTLERFMAAGNMGAVYEAVGPEDARVALKVVLQTAVTQGGQQVIDRFKQEANLTSSLNSPHIVPTLDAGIDKELGVPYMCMPLMHGEDLESLLERVEVIHPTVAARIVRQACSALAVAHEAGVVHRDIKPGNMFLDHDDEGRITVRVLDFGIAKWQESNTKLTADGSLLGSPLYMPPEQFTNATKVSGQNDVWSLGMTLYHALSGTIPFFDEPGLVQLMLAITSKDVPWIQDEAPWIPARLGAIVHGALIRDLPKRCPSAKELKGALWEYAYGSDDLHVDMLQPLDGDTRKQKAERGKPPETWDALREAAKDGGAGPGTDPLPSIAATLIAAAPPDELASEPVKIAVRESAPAPAPAAMGPRPTAASSPHIPNAIAAATLASGGQSEESSNRMVWALILIGVLAAAAGVGRVVWNRSRAATAKPPPAMTGAAPTSSAAAR